MNETIKAEDNRQWLRYIETLRRQSQPVKIDILLQKRMQAFIQAREAMICSTEK